MGALCCGGASAAQSKSVPAYCSDASKPVVAADTSLQHVNAELRKQLAIAESKAVQLEKGLQEAHAQAALERLKLQSRLDAANIKLEVFQTSKQLHHESKQHQDQVDSHDRSHHALLSIRAANLDSKLPALWTGPDTKRWEGVRQESNMVTGLSLNGASISCLPPEVGDLPLLTAMMLSNNSLSSVPSTVGKLENLTCLLLDNNALKDLPDELVDLTLLQTLWLQDNQLTSLPVGIGRLVNLRHLLCTNNLLTRIPDSIKDMSSLTSLWLDGNQLSILPASVAGITSLRRLRVDGHLLEALPAELTRVTACDQGTSGDGGSHRSSK